MLRIFAVVVVLLIALFIAVSLKARRLDRLHQTVVKARRMLELALRARAQRSLELAESGVLDVASSLVLADAAERCLSAGTVPIVNDGLDSVAIATSMTFEDDRCAYESALSRTLRLTVDAASCDIPEEARAALERARLDVRMTRTFHNSHVDHIRHFRRGFWTRALHLAGTAPMPETIDIDDE